MDRVKQEEHSGCGLACIAMIAEVSYQDVREVAVDLGWKEFHTETKDLRELGSHFDLDIGKRRRAFKTFQELPDLTILAINYNPKDDTWHWVVFQRTEDDQFIYDPRKSVKTDKRKDFGRIQAKWYLPVEKCNPIL